ncbi:ImmA/IrrE family metallo-endopeptidase [Bacillus swezeyi]|nr:ImmA/IrrE family metallo-endopeptidase [Bacillus swezeyi]MED2978363.1 ImmA/IrrE family metallo-endopeptidase [Bacillus swezeyi]
MEFYLSHLEEYVKNMYLKFGFTEPHQIDMTRIAASLNIWIHYEHVNSMMIKHDGMYSIILNSSLSRKKQWEDFAHELCHVLKHAGNQLNMNQMFRELQEFQANQFMYHFCVPTFMLLKLDFPQLRCHAVKMIADLFHVTDEFASKRIELFEKRQIGMEFHKAWTDSLQIAAEDRAFDCHDEDELTRYKRKSRRPYSIAKSAQQLFAAERQATYLLKK